MLDTQAAAARPTFSQPSFGEKFSTTRDLLKRNIAEVVAGLPPGKPLHCIDTLGPRIWLVRDPQIMLKLADDQRLDRGASHGVVGSIFGKQTLFLLPRGAEHSEKKTALKNHFSKSHVMAFAPRIAAIASAAVENIASQEDSAVDMNDHLLRYLFKVAGSMVCGRELDLDRYSQAFHSAFETIISTAASTVKMALSAISGLLGEYLAGNARAAARGLFPIGKALILAGSGNGQPNFVVDTLRRHGLDASAVDESTVFPDAVLYDVTMMFSASIITTSNLILAVMNYYSQNPAALQELRRAIKLDFPDNFESTGKLENTPALQKLLMAMLENSPVDIVARDVETDFSFTECQGTEHALKKGEMVLFDMPSMQRQTLLQLKARIQLAPATAPLLDFLDARNNDVIPSFFSGAFQCPGRFLAIADSILFLLPALSKLDCRWLKEKEWKHSLVNHFPGSPLMEVKPVAAPEAGTTQWSRCPFTARGINPLNI